MTFDEPLVVKLRAIASLKNLSSREITHKLTDSITVYLQNLGWDVITEYAVDLYREGIRNNGEKYRYQGRVDIYACKNGQALVIEIDRSNKQWSFKKLVHCSEHMGTESIWIRWKGKVSASRDKKIKVYNIAP